MRTMIRSSVLDDAPQISNIIKLAFGDDTTISQVENCILKGNSSLVAENDGQILGFVDGFLTLSIKEEKRRELDLLAVHPDCQGQGIGTKLITHYTNLNIPADFIRTLIAVGNIRMEKALARFGYQTEEDVLALYVSSAISSKISIHRTRQLIPVSTFTYDGIWLEGQITQGVIDAAFSSKQREKDIVGAVVPVTDIATVGLLQANNFMLIKLYRYWLRPILK